ncbi:hypothetical protein Catovirus_1_822 [Catovirus CTV1]|uniref:Uncharacterized protein n=1 Tax=Catovirus CTV1 TaxID=1977631 RepID=A0A1V0SAN2_9VIRU|nr:hypothetical protein Catovirus_1_822 [Catovirus CTV1]
MSLEYEFGIQKTQKVKLFYILKNKFNLKIIKIEDDKCIFKCNSMNDIIEITELLINSKNASITYVIKIDNDKNELNVLFDTDINYYNTEEVSDKESRLLNLVYDNLSF